MCIRTKKPDIQLDDRTLLSDIPDINSADFVRRLRRIATKRGWAFAENEGRGHTKITRNDRRTVIPRHAADLKTGTLNAILKQLELTRRDIEE